MKRKTEKTINIISWVLVIILILSFVKFIFIPSYNSYISVCDIPTAEQKNLITLGTTKYNYTDEKITITIKSDLNEEKRKETIKHELVHMRQFQRGLIPTCSQPELVMLSEIEAYTFEKVPDWLYEKVYRMDRIDLKNY